MNDEIKEIYFSNLEWTKTHDNMGGVMGNVIFKNNMSYEEYNKLFKSGYFIICDKDYITNLQEENERLKNEQISKYQTLKELQDENERLTELCNKYEEEHKTTFKIWEKDLKNFEHEKNRELKSRIDKAVEYIDKNIIVKFNKLGYKTDTVAGIVVDDLLEILKGSDKYV